MKRQKQTTQKRNSPVSRLLKYVENSAAYRKICDLLPTSNSQNPFAGRLMRSTLALVILLGCEIILIRNGHRHTQMSLDYILLATCTVYYFTPSLIGFFKYRTLKKDMRKLYPENEQRKEEEFTHPEETRKKYEVKEIIIPFGTQNIESGAYYDYKGLERVEIPETVRTIGDRAFEYCEALSEVVLPDSVGKIGKYAFSRCYQLRSLRIPSVTEICEGIFEYCTALETVTLSAKTWGIEERAFSHCSNLTKFDFPTSVALIGKEAFAYSGLEQLTLPATIKTVKEGAFKGCGKLKKADIQISSDMLTDEVFTECRRLEEVVFSGGGKRIENRLFCGFVSLKRVVLPDGIEQIGDEAFADSGLEEIIIPDSLQSIGRNAFYNCRNLVSLRFAGTEAEWKQVKKPYDDTLKTLETCNQIHFTDPSAR